MKKIILFLSLISLISCHKSDLQFAVSNDLQKRVIIIEGYDPYVTSYVSDSIIEYYQNKMILRKESYLKLNINAPYISTFSTYEYNANNYLVKIKNYNDIGLSDHYATSDYLYNESNKIAQVVFNRFSPSNFSNTLINNSTRFEYISDTIKTYSINHLNNDMSTNLKQYVVYGNLDSIQADNKWMYIFDNQNHLDKINCVGNDCDTYYNQQYSYESNREPLINNMYGNDLNLFLLRQSTKYYWLETAKKYTSQILYIYPTPDRNGEVRQFNYIFDENNRLIEMNTTGGTFAANDFIRYYYE
ncbi:MAG: hypothetical protein JXR05_10120 [Flavobacteriaceae bacterium]